MKNQLICEHWCETVVAGIVVETTLDTGKQVQLPHMFGISYSPWTYKSRWALANRGLAYRYSEYTPMISKWMMRMRLRCWSESLTVPLMMTEQETLFSSWDIGVFAEQHGTGNPLQMADPRVQHWNRLSDRILELGRIRISLSIRHEPNALKAALPSGLRWIPGGRMIARQGVNYMLKTYPVDVAEDQLIEQTATLLAEVRAGLAGKPYLLEQPSYADLAVASCLQMVRPVAAGIIPLNSDLHSVWAESTLSASFDDLCHWRDETMRELNAPLLG